jgi:hypothetical protein
MARLRLTKQEIEIASMFFVDEVPQHEIAAWFRVDQSSISRTLSGIAGRYPELQAFRRAAGNRPRTTPISNLATAKHLMSLLWGGRLVPDAR